MNICAVLCVRVHACVCVRARECVSHSIQLSFIDTGAPCVCVWKAEDLERNNNDTVLTSAFRTNLQFFNESGS